MDKFDEKARELKVWANDWPMLEYHFAQTLRDVAREIGRRDYKIAYAYARDWSDNAALVAERIGDEIKDLTEEVMPTEPGRAQAGIHSANAIPGRVTPPGVEQEGSGHECAARKALTDIRSWAQQQIDAPTPQAIYMQIVKVAEMALAQPCPSGMSRDQAEKMAAEIIRPFDTFHLDDTYQSIVARIADALQRVSSR